MYQYIRTYTGEIFYPLNPEPEKIHIKDIAHALSLLCRGNGHIKSFWSVGQHSICCAREAMARGYSNRLALACLLHDASECYLSDIPRPFKQNLPEYKEWEDQLLDMVYQKYLGEGLSAEEQVKLKEIDDAMLWYDLELLLDERQDAPAPKIHIEIDYTVRSFIDVETEFLELFEELMRDANY